MQQAILRVISGFVVVALVGSVAVGAAAPPRPAPRVRPRPRPSTGGALPEGPETPPEKLPAQYFGTLGETEIQYRQWSKAEAAFAKAYEREKDDARRAQYAYRLGQLHMRKKDYEKARPLLEEAVANLEDGGRSYQARQYRTTLASLYEKMGETDKVEALYQNWLEEATNRYEKDLARRRLLSFWKRTGKLDVAIEGYEAALGDDPTDKDILATLRLIYTSVKPDPKKALEVTEKLAAADPDDRDTALYLVSAYERARKYDKAIPLLKELIEKNPRDASFLGTRLVNLYVQNDQRDKAVAYAKDMLDDEPDNAQTHSRVAAIYQRLNMTEEAIAQYQAAAELARSDAQRDRYLLSAAHGARRAKQYDKAEQIAKKLARSGSKVTAAQAKRLLFDLYEEQNKLDLLELEPKKKEDDEGN
ncbi:MAG: tetratricopeptide repeat protein [Planctomycetota bacterium]